VLLYGLIVTAKLNDVDLPAWLADVLPRIADHPASRLERQLLPDPKADDRVCHRIRRQIGPNFCHQIQRRYLDILVGGVSPLSSS
jgi:hypothetical protein